MWWRILLSNLKLISAVGSSFAAESTHLPLSTRASSISAYSSLFARQFGSATAETVVKKKRVEDVMPIATGHEKEELEAEFVLLGRKLLDIDFPEGPFGTKEAPAIVKSYYHMRIVGCPGGEAEDEHDVVWFWLEKGKSVECPACSQYFKAVYPSFSLNLQAN
ncbi:unnamed protein product [Brassica oleracea var. botrytis]